VSPAARRPASGIPDRPRSASWAVVTALTLVTLATIALGWFRVFDSDLFWHIRTGDEILREHRLEPVDVYSHTARGTPFINFEWLADVVAAGLHRAGGFELIVVVKALLGGVLVLVLAAAARERGAGGLALCWALLNGLLLLRFRLLARPEIVSLVLIALFDFAAVRYRHRGTRRWLVATPFVTVPWANAHLLVVMGIVVLATHALGAGLTRARAGRDRSAGDLPPRATPLLAAALACFAATLVNPYGLLVYRPLIQIASSEPIIALGVREWAAPDSGGFLLFLLLAPAATVVVAATARSLPLADAFLWAGGLAMACQSQRHIGIFAVLSTPILARQLTAAAGWLGPRLHRWLPTLARLAAPPLRLALFAATLLWAVITLLRPEASWLHQDQSRHFVPGLGVDRRVAPVDAVEWIWQQRLEGPLYNSYRFGGYLIWRSWPRLEVFLDGRHYVYEDFLAWLQVRRPEDVLRQLDIRLGLVAWADRWLRAFRADADFALVYFDDVALVFARRDSARRHHLEPFHRLRPEDLSLRWLDGAATADLEAAAAEAERAVALAPLSARAWMLRGLIARRRGESEASIAAFQRAVVLDPAQAAAHNNLGTTLLDAGRLEAALGQFERAVALDPRQATGHYNTGLALDRLGDHRAAFAAFGRAARLDPGFAAAWLNLGLLDDDPVRAAGHLRKFLSLSRDPVLRRRAEQRLTEIEQRR